jgi:tight adherence protein C
MSTLAPELLAALLTAGLVTMLALCAFELSRKFYQRYFSGAQLPVAPDERQPRVLQLLRRIALPFLAAMNDRWVPASRLAQIDVALRKAGTPLELRAAEIVAFMELLALTFFLLGVAFSLWLGLGISTCIVFTLFGAGYPLLWLRDKVKARHHAISRALPYNLDLLTLSVEAGLDFAAALGKVAVSGRKGPLTDELAVTLKELKLGKTREEALRALSQRVDLPSLSTFVHALVQADKMGTSLGKMLRIQSTQLRIERTQRAEKLANEAPVKLLIPLIGFIFPTVFIMLFGPIAYQVFFGGSF